MDSFDKSLLTVLRVCAYLVPFTLLIVSTGLLFPYITGKAFALRLLTEVAVAAALILLLRHPELRPAFALRATAGKPKPDWVIWASFALLASLFLLVPFSIRPGLSLWGNAERMEGAWGVMHFFLWFYALAVLLRAQPEAGRGIFWSFATVGSLIGLQELYEGLVLKTDRPYATLGNATYIGFLSVLLIFLALTFWERYRGDRLVRGILVVLIAILSGSLLVSQTRGSILALGVGLIVYAMARIAWSSWPLKRKALLVVVIGALLAGSVGFLQTPLALRIPGVSRVASSLAVGGGDTYKPRLISWGIFWDGWRSRPLTGYGLENAPIAYYEHFNPDMFRYEEVIFDRPHNKFLEVLVTQGVVGFGLWVIFLIAAFLGLRNLPRGPQRAALLGFLVAYLVGNATLFDMQASYLAFFFALALMIRSVTPGRAINRSTTTILAAVPVALLIAGLTLNIWHYLIARQIIDNLVRPPTVAIPAYVALSERAGPFLQEEGIMVRGYTDQHLRELSTLEEFDGILTVYRRAHAVDSLDLRLAEIYTAHLASIVVIEHGNKLPDRGERAEAEAVFLDLLHRYPNFPDTYLNYASFLAAAGDRDQAIQMLVRGRPLLAKSRRLAHAVAGIFSAIGAPQEALAFVQAAEKNGVLPQNVAGYLIRIEVFARNDRLDEARQAIKNMLAIDASAATVAELNRRLINFGHPELAVRPAQP